MARQTIAVAGALTSRARLAVECWNAGPVIRR
jgi:hypothetical protein